MLDGPLGLDLPRVGNLAAGALDAVDDAPARPAGPPGQLEVGLGELPEALVLVVVVRDVFVPEMVAPVVGYPSGVQVLRLEDLVIGIHELRFTYLGVRVGRELVGSRPDLLLGRQATAAVATLR